MFSATADDSLLCTCGFRNATQRAAQSLRIVQRRVARIAPRAFHYGLDLVIRLALDQVEGARDLVVTAQRLGLSELLDRCPAWVRPRAPGRQSRSSALWIQRWVRGDGDGGSSELTCAESRAARAGTICDPSSPTRGHWLPGTPARPIGAGRSGVAGVRATAPSDAAEPRHHARP